MEKRREDKSVVVVVTPLTVIIKTQISELRSLGIKAVNNTGEINEGTEEEICAGEFSILFGTPETWIRKEKW